MSRQPAPHDFRRAGIIDRGRGQTIEAKDDIVVRVVNRQECLRPSEFMALSGVTAEEFVQCRLATVESLTIMYLADRLLVPRSHHQNRFGNARAALSSFAFGDGGFSSRSRTRKLSRSDSCTCSDSLMTVFAARTA